MEVISMFFENVVPGFAQWPSETVMELDDPELVDFCGFVPEVDATEDFEDVDLILGGRRALANAKAERERNRPIFE